MKAIVQGTYGSTDVLELRDVDRPEMADDEVMVSEVAHAIQPVAQGRTPGKVVVTI